MRAAPCESSVWIGTCQPWNERDWMPISLSTIGHQPGGDLLARGDDGVVLARIVQLARPR